MLAWVLVLGAWGDLVPVTMEYLYNTWLMDLLHRKTEGSGISQIISIFLLHLLPFEITLKVILNESLLSTQID